MPRAVTLSIRTPSCSGFTLVEISIVLVIIGLIVGGILVGREVIQGAERRAVIREQEQYRTALNAFRMKYNALPGDMANATLYWGKDAVDCNMAPGSVGAPGTCNGDGDGTIGESTTGENWRAWQHLAGSGVIPGAYLGKPDGSGNRVIGLTVPKSKFPGGGWNIGYRLTNVVFGRGYRHFLEIAGAPNGLDWDNGAIFRAVDAEEIDRKVDDGLPDRGKAFFFKGDIIPPPTPSPYCVANVHSAPMAGAVDLVTEELACRMYFWLD
jgi:prepilin-type N-terminal cleavage/methylation domain-containing protein